MIEKTIADAILDRIVHNAHRIELKEDAARGIYERKAKTGALKRLPVVILLVTNFDNAPTAFYATDAS